MAKGSTKFGTFGGVFVPSVLTILGVIMYLRLPWVVGNGGLVMTLGIIAAAHVISVTTGLSISSIATDKKVGAGGPYYIISRSMGLPIGGTLGLALFVGLSFSVSLYVIGFCESFLAVLVSGGWLDSAAINETNIKNTIRIAGTLTLLGVTTITLISTALAIKTQYFIFVAIVVSILAIVFGHSEVVPTAVHLDSAESSPGFEVLFGIFFPAVTGFTAGVNMSGDLRDPKRSIPLGTMAAIGTGFVVYVALAIFCAYRIQPNELVDNTQVFPAISLSLTGTGEFVLAGIWGATLSSAMGSILGAPRILQALSVDHVTPRFFGKGAGKSNEPRRALLLAVVIAEGGILMGELDAIAEIVSIFFMATYGFLNVSCAIESWASTDFRPTFKIPKLVSVIGGATCVLLMIILNIGATAGAAVIMAGVFIWLKRRELALESGDTWVGVYFSMVRSNLTRLSRNARLDRDFRPNVLSFSRSGSPARPEILEFGNILVRGGVLTDVEIIPTGRDALRTEARAEEVTEDDDEDLPPGVFHKPLRGDDPVDAMGALIEYHGFPGLEPNTVMLPWPDEVEDIEPLITLVGKAVSRDLNVIVVAPNLEWEPATPAQRKIDFWWSPKRGNFSFALTLARYFSMSDDYRFAEIRFLLVNDDISKTEALYRTASRLCVESRLEATVKVLNNTLGERKFDDWVRRESADADLLVLGFPKELGRITQPFFAATGETIQPLGNVLLLRPSSAFTEVLHLATESRLAKAAAMPAGEDTLQVVLPKLELPPEPELANEALRVSGRLDAVAAEFEEACIAPAYRVHKELTHRILSVVEVAFEQLIEGAHSAGHRQRKTIARVHNSFLQQASGILGDFQREDLESIKESVETRIDWFLGELAKIKEGAPLSTQVVYRGGEKRYGDDEESGEKPRTSKTRVRKVVVPLDLLLSYHLDYESPKVLSEALKQAVRFGSHAAVDLTKALNSVRMSLALISGKVRSGEITTELVAGEAERVLGELRALVEEHDESRRAARQGFLRSARQIAIEFSWDLNRPDLRTWVRRDRRVPRTARDLVSDLSEVPQVWIANESLLTRRAELELTIAAFQTRLAVIAERTGDSLSVDLRGGVADQLEKVVSNLRVLMEGKQEIGKIRFEGAHDLGEELDEKRIVDELARKTQAATASLPESFVTLNEEAILRVEEEPFEEVEGVTVPVRRRVEFLVQAELVGQLQRGLNEAAAAERRALGVARDVIRLVSFNINDLMEEEEEEGAFYNRLKPIIEEGLERLQGELDKVKSYQARLSTLLGRQMELVVERTDAYAITGSDDGLRHYAKAEGARQIAFTRVQEVSDRVQKAAKDALSWVFYRRSQAMIGVHQLQAGLDPQETMIDEVLSFVRDNTPNPKVLDSLPFYYQQPFLGKTRISADFWVGRSIQMANAARAVEHSKQGSKGALIVTGERNSGKSALSRAIANAHFRRDRIHHVVPPSGGSIELSAFKVALEAEFGAQGSANSLFSILPEGSVVVFHDLELWWERSTDGLAIIENLLKLIEEHGERCFFILNLGIRALRFIKRISLLTDQAIAIIECGPMKAEILKQIVVLRHRSTGLRLQLNGRDEDELAEWRLARLFGRHFDYSGGVVGVALQSWITHIDGVDGRTIDIVSPVRPNMEVLYELPMEWVSLLLELVIHNQITFSRFQRFTEIIPSDLRHMLNTLCRMGLVTETKQGVIELNRFVEHLVTGHLRERGLLS